MYFDLLVEEILNNNTTSYANQGIVFLDSKGCCIGVEHGKSIDISQDLIDRIKKIPNLKFYAEGVAAKDPSKEPGMMPFIEKNFPGYTVQGQSWDEITENQNKGTANKNLNIVYVFMQHEYNKLINQYDYTKGTMLDALAKPKTYWPKNSPRDYNERKQWLTYHMRKAGFYDRLEQPYNREELIGILDEMEKSVYPPGQQFPDTSTYFGQLMHSLEEERNQTIHDLMGEGGCCFAGSGHLIELKQQFPNLTDIDLGNI